MKPQRDIEVHSYGGSYGGPAVSKAQIAEAITTELPKIKRKIRPRVLKSEYDRVVAAKNLYRKMCLIFLFVIVFLVIGNLFGSKIVDLILL